MPFKKLFEKITGLFNKHPQKEVVEGDFTKTMNKIDVYEQRVENRFAKAGYAFGKKTSSNEEEFDEYEEEVEEEIDDE